MNAIPNALREQAQQLADSVTRPISGSRKVHIDGSRPDLRVPMREIVLAQTQKMFGPAEANAPLPVYDTSGASTNPDAPIDLAAGLAALGAAWVDRERVVWGKGGSSRVDLGGLSQLKKKK